MPRTLPGPGDQTFFISCPMLAAPFPFIVQVSAFIRSVQAAVRGRSANHADRGHHYWLSIFNDTTGDPGIWGWGGQQSSGLLAGFRLSPAVPWSSFSAELDFQLTNDNLPPFARSGTVYPLDPGHRARRAGLQTTSQKLNPRSRLDLARLA